MGKKTRAVFDRDVVLHDSSSTECLQHLLIEGALGAFLELGLSMYYALMVLQTGLLVTPLTNPDNLSQSTNLN